MRILVAGIGGIGGWLAAVLAKGGADVQLFARGAALEKLRRDGLVFISGDARETFRLKAFDTPATGAHYDAIVIATKTQDFPAICAGLAPLLNEGVHVIAAVNGLPWWFLPDMRLESIDPGGKAASLLARVTPVGAVVHASAHALEPGVVRLAKADRLILGDAPGHATPFAREFAAIVERGGVAAPMVDDIRAEIWAKLWGNMNMNPISALTRLSSKPILDTPELRALVLTMMQEFDAIGQKLGLPLPMGADERIEITLKLGDFRTSMLADATAGRRLEHEGILGCVVELADKLNVAAPSSRIVHALLKGLDLSFGR